jgi:hypothetical protein
MRSARQVEGADARIVSISAPVYTFRPPNQVPKTDPTDCKADVWTGTYLFGLKRSI